MMEIGRRIEGENKMSTEFEFPKIEHRPIDDPEFGAIKEGVCFMEFVEFMKNKDLENIRLPINNQEAYQYLRWVNEYFCGNNDGNYLNYILNLWDGWISNKPVRPPTPREIAICAARRIVKNADDKEIADNDRGLYIDSDAELIRDAYRYWNYPDWIMSGLAGCVMKWGTFEDNVKPDDEIKYIPYEEYN